METFKNYSYYYNLFYGDKDYTNEALMVKKLIDQNKEAEIATVLNIGCGTGKHDSKLEQIGYKIHGIDLSDSMLEIAKRENQSITYEQGDARTYRSKERFDAVVSLFHVMSYQNTNDDIIKSFKTAYEALGQKGIFVFDAWYGPGVLTDRPATRVKQVEDKENLVIRYAKPIMHVNENIVDVYYDVVIINKETNVANEIKEVHNMRYFFVPEIKEYLEEAGFELVDVRDCNTLQEPDWNSWTVYFVARKIV